MYIDKKYCNFTSRKEINKQIKKLQIHYVYNAYNELSKKILLNEIEYLRMYKNIYFPKRSFIHNIFTLKTVTSLLFKRV